ncbi:hypothetical protein LU293_01210 [Moraxella nasovis]|uniref:hypothetical protein n=1 Tax=Moraxella nasovis TaxID=2904121 RepID=UPI001F61AF8A|nr:hypothetical protein [Moraxella nasovis]UNU73561.1 hypothetical protein LU293_01210 [Moraxella nasovis]
MKKLLLSTLVASLALTACHKAEQKTEEVVDTTRTAVVDTQTTQEVQTTQPVQETHDHDDHDHDGTQHNMGELYQCGDIPANIAEHNHEGKREAHLTLDEITYDLDADAQSPNRYISDDDSIANDNKGMILDLSDNTAKITSLDGKPLLDCVRQQ